jgi:hypothetical protein
MLIFRWTTLIRTAEKRLCSAPIELRWLICALQTALNFVVVIMFVVPLYDGTAHHPLQRLGVALLFAALLMSLARV